MRYPVKAINILKAHGKSSHDSQLIGGYALNMSRAAQVRLFAQKKTWMCAPRPQPRQLGAVGLAFRVQPASALQPVQSAELASAEGARRASSPAGSVYSPLGC